LHGYDTIGEDGQMKMGLDAFIAFVVYQIGGDFSYRLGHFLRKGMKPSPALGK
jgi:hypothetical protein